MRSSTGCRSRNWLGFYAPVQPLRSKPYSPPALPETPLQPPPLRPSASLAIPLPVLRPHPCPLHLRAPPYLSGGSFRPPLPAYLTWFSVQRMRCLITGSPLSARWGKPPSSIRKPWPHPVRMCTCNTPCCASRPLALLGFRMIRLRVPFPTGWPLA